jgi:AbrB family looped-hinge helix DNA binding protein
METVATTKGQVVIPFEIRRKLGIEAGTRIQVEMDEAAGQIILTPITREYIHSLRGKYRGKNLLKALADEKAREKAAQ